METMYTLEVTKKILMLMNLPEMKSRLLSTVLIS